MTDTLDLAELEHQAPTVRRPGDFRRRGADGPPLVLDPTGARTAAGKVRTVTYGRPSGFHRWIDNGIALERWNERMLLLGAVQMLDDGDELGLEDLDGTIVEAKRRAGARLAAERGTGVHELTHRLHALERAEVDLIAHLGELGLSEALVAAIADAYTETLERYDLEVLASEVRACDDIWLLAGSPDRIVRLRRALRFGNVELPAGTVLILDLKTGRLRLADGEPQYWGGFALQLRSYAQSCRYIIDGEDERREPWPWPIDRSNGLILHLDIAGALETDVVTSSLWWNDLEAGYVAGELASCARAWSKATGVFAAASEPPVLSTVHVEPSRLEVALETTLVRRWLQDRVDVLGGYPAGRRLLPLRWPAGVPALRASDEHTPEQLSAIEDVLDDLEAELSVPFGPPRPGSTEPVEGWAHHLLGAFPKSTIEEPF